MKAERERAGSEEREWVEKKEEREGRKGVINEEGRRKERWYRKREEREEKRERRLRRKQREQRWLGSPFLLFFCDPPSRQIISNISIKSHQQTPYD